MTTYANAGINTGGALGAGHIIHLGAAKPKVQYERNLDAVVQQISISILVLQCTKINGTLRKLMLTKLLEQDLQESQAVVVPTRLLCHQVDEHIFDKYQSQLASVTPSNWDAAHKKLLKLGIDGQGRILARET